MGRFFSILLIVAAWNVHRLKIHVILSLYDARNIHFKNLIYSILMVLLDLTVKFGFQKVYALYNL